MPKFPFYQQFDAMDCGSTCSRVSFFKFRLFFSLAFFIVLFLFENCSDKPTYPSFSFVDKQSVIEIPFSYSAFGYLQTSIVCEKDTFPFIVDTGATKSIVSSELGGEPTKNIANGTDILGTFRQLETVKINSLHWGNLELRNFEFAKIELPIEDFFGIIGGDVLSNFCVKIDNENQIISLSEKSDSIDKRGEKILCQFVDNSLYLKAKLGGKVFDFLFDSGYSGGTSCDSLTYFSSIPDMVETVVWQAPQVGLFVDINNLPIVIKTYCLSDFGLGEKSIENSIVSYSEQINENLVGTDFMRRFKSITIDYINSSFFVEYPNDNTFLNFSDSTIQIVPAASLNRLYTTINSLGIQIPIDEYPYRIHAMKQQDEFETVQIGDTLSGIDKIIFDEQVFQKLTPSQQSYFIVQESVAEQKEYVRNIFFKGEKASFHFYKNGILNTLNVVRDSLFNPPPVVAYSYGLEDYESGYFAFIVSMNSPSGIFINFPWSTLAKEDIEISVFKNGIEQKRTNKSEFINLD